MATLITDDDVEPLGEQIDNLAFTFVAPLGADDSDNHKQRSEIRGQKSLEFRLWREGHRAFAY